MRLQVGNTYRNSNGDLRTIVEFDEDDQILPFKDNHHDWYTAEGIYDADDSEPNLNLVYTNDFTVRMTQSREANIAVIRLLLAQGNVWAINNCSQQYVAGNAGMLIIENGVINHWFCGWHDAYAEGTVLDASADPVPPVDTNVTFADGTKVELSLESYNKLRNA